MKRVVLVRHGETVWHAENRYAGRSDVALTPRGLAQAQTLAAWSSTAGLQAIWSSPLSRARLTAEPASATTGLSLQIDPRLLEIDFGQAEGMTAREMEQAFPEARRAFLSDPAACPLPGGESPAAAVDRGRAALDDIAAALPENGRALAVAHNTLLRLLLCHVLGLPLAHYRTTFPHLANTSLTELGIAPGHVALLAFNAPLPQPQPEVE